jgi:Arc/MetJ-type ribon-helix-helix transcriptional regulator
MSVDLSPELERRISDAVAAGRFQTAEELVEAAVSRLLETRNGGDASLPGGRISLDPSFIPPAGRRLDLTNEQIYDLIEFP